MHAPFLWKDFRGTVFPLHILLSPNQFSCLLSKEFSLLHKQKDLSNSRYIPLTTNPSHTQSAPSTSTLATHANQKYSYMYISGVVLQKKKKPTQKNQPKQCRAQYDDENHQCNDRRTSAWEPLLPTSPLQPLLSHVTVLHCHRPSEQGISSAQLKTGKWTLQAAAARCPCYIQFLQDKEDGSSWQGALDWEAALRGPGSQPGNWICALSLIKCITEHPATDSPQAEHRKVENSSPQGEHRKVANSRFAAGHKESSSHSTKMSNFFLF